MPWLEVWIEEAEMIAKKMAEKDANFLGNISKKNYLSQGFIRSFYK